MCQCAEQITAKMNGQTPFQAESLPDEPLVRVLYDGETVPVARVEVIGSNTHKSYGRRERGEVFYVYKSDVTPERFRAL